MFKRNFSYILLLSLLSLPIAIFFAFDYVPNYSQETHWFKVIYIAATVGHFFLYYFLGSLILIFPFSYFKYQTKGFICYSTLILSLLSIILAIDANVYYLYRFHMNFAMLDLFLNGGGQIIAFSFEMIMSIVLEIALIVLYALATVLLSRFLLRKNFKFKILVALVLFAYLGANVAHAYAAAKNINSITKIQTILPLYAPLTANSLFIKMGLISKDSLANRKVSLKNDGLFNYPKEPLVFANNNKKLTNVFIFAIDALRFDMLTQEIMPNTYELARESVVFNNHFSASNSTRGAIFGLFYGLPPSYWQVALNAGKPAALIQSFKDNNYKLGIFSSAPLYKPEFNQTVFLGLDNLRIESDGNSVIDRDLDAINDFQSFVEQNSDKSMFAFVFLDNVHAATLPADAPHPFSPSLDNVNHLNLDKNDKEYVKAYFNLYKNAVHYADSNLQRLYDILKNNNLFENSVIIVTSDHGEEFDDNHLGYFGHNSNFTPIQVKIPLVIKWPGKLPYHEQKISSSYDISTTLMQDVLYCTNKSSDYSIGMNLFNLIDRNYIIAGSYLENAILEKDRIVLIDNVGILRFKDLNYNDSDNDTRSPHLFEALKIFSEYLEK